MNRTSPIDKTFAGVVRQEWRLALIFAWAVAGVGLGVYKAFVGGADAAVATRVSTRVSTLNPNTVMGETQMREVLLTVPAPPPPTVHEEKLGAVGRHRARYDANPEDPDAEALLRAMGNLYKQTGDFQNAAWAYQQLLKKFPQSRGRTAVYVELAGCFEQLTDGDNLTRLYLDMMKVFPKDSDEYKFAEAGIHRSDLKLRRRDPNARPESGPEGTFTVDKLADSSTHYADSGPEPDARASDPGQSPVP